MTKAKAKTLLRRLDRCVALLEKGIRRRYNKRKLRRS